MGKTPETLDGKLLKVRENKLRRLAARQGAKVTKLWKHGDMYLLCIGWGSGRVSWITKDGSGSRAGNCQLTLAEAFAALEARQRRTPDASVIAGPW